MHWTRVDGLKNCRLSLGSCHRAVGRGTPLLSVENTELGQTVAEGNSQTSNPVGCVDMMFRIDGVEIGPQRFEMLQNARQHGVTYEG